MNVSSVKCCMSIIVHLKLEVLEDINYFRSRIPLQEFPIISQSVCIACSSLMLYKVIVENVWEVW